MNLSDSLRKVVSATVVALTLSLSLAVPLMERGSLIGETSVESAHDASRCAHGHDHRVCTQVGANLSLAAPSSGARPLHVLVRTPASSEVRSAPTRASVDGYSSRAPPRI